MTTTNALETWVQSLHDAGRVVHDNGNTVVYRAGRVVHDNGKTVVFTDHYSDLRTVNRQR